MTDRLKVKNFTLTNPSTDSRTKKTHQDKTQSNKSKDSTRLKRDSMKLLGFKEMTQSKLKRQDSNQEKPKLKETKLNKRWLKSQEVMLKQNV